MSTASASPSVSDLLNAANWEYLQTGTPSSNLTAFKVNGKQLTGFNEADGFSAAVWQDTATHQLVVGFEGTQFIDPNAVASNPNFTINELKADITLLAGQIPQTLVDAFNFVTQVVEPDAAQQGYSASNLFVTGHSLGADEAEYVAERTGLGGIAFEGSGISSFVPAVGNGTNFISVVTYGDPFANYSSDILAEQPYAPTYIPHGGALPHYGEIIFDGFVGNEGALPFATFVSLFFGPLGTLAVDGINMLLFHQPETQAYYLGVHLNQTNSTEQNTGVTFGPGVWNVANDSISQFISDAQQQFTPWTLGLTLNWGLNDASLSDPLTNPTSGVSASFGFYSGIAAFDFATTQGLIDLTLDGLEVLVDAFDNVKLAA